MNANDFSEVNTILKDVAVKLPDVPSMEAGGYSIDLSNIICRDISLQDISLTSNRIDDDDKNAVQLQIKVEGLTFICTAEYKYRGLLGMVNRGDVSLYSSDNYVTTSATISSTSNDSSSSSSSTNSIIVPTTIRMTECTPRIEIRDVDFMNGGFVGWILDAIEGLLRTAMENLASTKICYELQKMVRSKVKVKRDSLCCDMFVFVVVFVFVFVLYAFNRDGIKKRKKKK